MQEPPRPCGVVLTATCQFLGRSRPPQRALQSRCYWSQRGWLGPDRRQIQPTARMHPSGLYRRRPHKCPNARRRIVFQIDRSIKAAGPDIGPRIRKWHDNMMLCDAARRNCASLRPITRIAYSSPPRQRRERFTSLRSRFDASRRFREPAVARVARRTLGGRSPARSSSTNRSSDSRRFIAWVRWTSQTIRNVPSASIRPPSAASSRCFCSSESPRDSCTLKRSVTRVFTLLTFCPPGPELRSKTN